VICMQDLFLFERRGISSDGRTLGVFTATGIRPRFAEKLKTAGFDLPVNIFDPANRRYK
jgi:pilus assembly protein CpaF